MWRITATSSSTGGPPRDEAYDKRVLATINHAIDNTVATKLNEELQNAPPAEKTEIKKALGIPANENEYRVKLWEHLYQACCRVTSDRGEPGRSLDTVLRDAEYYLRSRFEVARQGKGFRSMITWIVKPIGYDVLKAMIEFVVVLLRKIGLEDLSQEVDHWLRAGANPNSPPGGFYWAIQGVLDAMDENGDALVTRAPHATRTPAGMPLYR